MKEFIESILWTPKSVAVNLTTLKKDNLGTTSIPVHACQTKLVFFSFFILITPIERKCIERFQCKSLMFFYLLPVRNMIP